MSVPPPRDFDEAATEVASGGSSELPTDRPAADRVAVAALEARLGDGSRAAMELRRDADELVVGRGASCDWQLDDPSLSRRHAVFHWDGGRLLVEDMGSANGTRMDGRKIQGQVEVPRGRSVQIGKVLITVVARGAPLPGAATGSDPPPATAEPLQELDDALLVAEPSLQWIDLSPEPGNGRVAPAASPPARTAAAPTPLHGAETPVGGAETPMGGPPALHVAGTRVGGPPALHAMGAPAAFHGAETLVGGPSALHAAETRLTTVPPPGARAARSSRRQPSGGRAVAGEPATRSPWSAGGERAARPARHSTARPLSRRLDPAPLWSAVKQRWRRNRLPFLFAAATAGMALLALALVLGDREPHPSDSSLVSQAGPARPRRALLDGPLVRPIGKRTREGATALPAVTSLALEEERGDPSGAPAGGGGEHARDLVRGPTPATGDRAALLAVAIAAYDMGHTEQALAAFRRLAASDPSDAAARYMVDLLSARARRP